MRTNEGRMTRIRRAAVLTGLLGGLALGCCAARPAAAFEQRAGTISLGLQGGAGFFSGQGTYERGVTRVGYGEYDWQGGFAIRLRYGLDRTHALGFSFEDLRFDRKSGADPTLPGQYQVNNFLVDYYLYFHRPYKLSRYLVLGAGFHRPTFRLDDEQNIFPGEGITANFGGGLEYFVRRALSIDGSVRLYYLRPKDGSGSATELMLGLQYYLVN